MIIEQITMNKIKLNLVTQEMTVDFILYILNIVIYSIALLQVFFITCLLWS
jgi:hypothetical protein